MPWVPDFLLDLAERTTAAEATILLGLVLVAFMAVVLPVATLRRKRSYRMRDAEFRRLQNM